MKKILISGLINIETTLFVEHFPIEYKPIDYNYFGINTSISGVGYNITKAIKTLGSLPYFLSIIGKDIYQDIITNELNKRKIDTRLFELADSTAQSIILYDEMGMRKIYLDLNDTKSSTSTTITTDIVKTEENTTENSTQMTNTKELTLGEINDDVYTNEYFNFKITLPTGWYSLSEEQRKSVHDAGAEIITQDDEVKKEYYDLSMQNSLSLFILYEKNPVEATSYNPSISMVAEKLPTLTQVFITSGEQYLESIKSQLSEVKEMNGIPLEYNFVSPENITLGNKDFSVLHIEASLNNGQLIIFQDYYATKVDNYMLGIVTSYLSGEQKYQLENSLQSITFNE